jgi:hypothetical protein
MKKILKILTWILFPYIKLSKKYYKFIQKTKLNFALKLISLCTVFLSLCFFYFVFACLFSGIMIGIVTGEGFSVNENYTYNSYKKSSKANSNSNTIETKKPKIISENVIDKDTAIEVLRKHYKGIANISFNRKENSINIYPLDENFMFAVYQAKKGDAYSLKHWNNITEDTRKTTGLLEDETLSINILNNLNGKIILSCMNSKIIYNEVK